jgi:hypothetical protein
MTVQFCTLHPTEERSRRNKYRCRICRKLGTKPVPEQAPTAKPEPTLDYLLQANQAQAADTAAKRQLKAAQARILEQQGTIARLSSPMARPALPTVRRLSKGSRLAWGLSCLSDVHAGALVEPTRSTCMNSYTPEVCRHRLDRYFESIAWLIRDERSFDVLGHLLWLGGDLIDGHLHDDQVETSEAPLVTMNWLEPYLLGRIQALASELGGRELRIMCTFGNHGRDTLKPRAETAARHSHEWALYQRIARHFASHRTIRVITDTARDQYTEIFGRTIHGTHGDTVNYAGGVGGITIPLRKAYATWQTMQPSYLHLTGHYHTQLDLGDGLANGSVVGYNAFARKINARPEVAQQLFCLLDSERGKTKVSPIWVHDPSGEEKLALADARKVWTAERGA